MRHSRITAARSRHCVGYTSGVTETQEAPNGQAVDFAGNIATGPDGKPWGVLHIATPLMQSAVFLTPDAADKLAEALPAMLTALAAELRRQRSGLVVAQTVPAPNRPER